MVNTEIRLIIFFADKDGEVLYRQKQDQELTVAQIIFSCMAWRAIPGPLSKRKRRLDYLEAAQGASVVSDS